MVLFVPIVEGHGEVHAVPALLHRLVAMHPCPTGIRVNQPIRVKSGSFLQDQSYFEKYAALASERAAQDEGVVLIMLDCEDDCPARLGPTLLVRARAVRDDICFLVALAYREFESWFIASIESIRGHFGIAIEVNAPPRVEAIRDAKGWLGQHMDTTYDPIVHQREMTRLLDVEMASASASFARLRAHVNECLERACANA